MLEIMKASAGSGKTYSLALKYITLLLKSKDKYAYRHILAVTFTNKATEEMKTRILKELHILASSPADSGYHDQFVPSLFSTDKELQTKAESVLHDILHDYSAFAVSTIDRFFQHTLKAFSREIGQFASYQVELDKDSLVAESVDRVLDALTEDDDTLLSWLTANVLEQIEQGGRYSPDANLLEMAKRLRSPQRQEAMDAAGLTDEQIYSKEKLVKVRERCRGVISTFLSEVKSKAAAALKVILEAGVDPKESNRGFMSALYDYTDIDMSDRISAPKDTFISKAMDSDQWFSKAKAKVLLPKVYPFLQAPIEDFCALFGKPYAVYNTAIIIDRQLYGLGVARELDRSFNDIMKEKNVLCIDDSNTILRDIIDGSDAPFVYEKLGVRYEHFLLDEFQDTAGVQWQNFSPLLKNSDSQGGENLVVGDVKQSIYRWRGSDWKLLNDTIPAEFPGHRKQTLDTNWRSLSNIIDFNNGFFVYASALLDRMDGHEGDGPVSQIYADVVQKIAKKDKPSGSVSLTFCDKEQQLQKVLDAVMEACAHGARLSDIAVLVRSNASGEEVASYLMENGISVITDDSLKVKGSVTVRRLVSLLSYTENPADTVSGYLASSLDVSLPECCRSLSEMAESLLRSLMESDQEGVWRGEILHIQSFMDHLLDYVSINGNSLRGFLKWWEGEDPSISSPASGNSVRIMTIHKSKGLDFPYVILPFAENINLYKPSVCWCSSKFAETELEDVAEGIYDVNLSSSSVSTLFAGDYRRESLLQAVDNINTLYVAMTRAALGMHIIAKTPPAVLFKPHKEGALPPFKDFSQMLYMYMDTIWPAESMVRSADETGERFDIGEMVDFGLFRKDGEGDETTFEVTEGEEYPSIRERGRLKLSADAADFFSEDGCAGMTASSRIRGVVLHDILSRVVVPEDLEESMGVSRAAGDISSEEVESVQSLLSQRIHEVEGYGWFPDEGSSVMNEVNLIDTDGAIYRPDRVVVKDGKVMIIDYKFGEHRGSYERQVQGYARIWKRMGYKDVTAFLWYVQTGEVMKF